MSCKLNLGVLDSSILQRLGYYPVLSIDSCAANGTPLDQLPPYPPLSPNGEEDYGEGGRRNGLVALPMQGSIIVVRPLEGGLRKDDRGTEG